MGQAKSRGSFQERQEKAIAEGRVKRPAEKRKPAPPEDSAVAYAMMALMMGRMGRMKRGNHG